MTKNIIKLDPDSNLYVGQKELIVDSPADLMPFLKCVEKERNISPTAMNSTSSRSNAIMELKYYVKSGSNVTITFFKILDLAGSERVEKAGT